MEKNNLKLKREYFFGEPKKHKPKQERCARSLVSGIIKAWKKSSSLTVSTDEYVRIPNSKFR